VAFSVQCSEYAATQLRELKAKAKASPESAHGAVWEMVKKAIKEVVANSDLNTASKFALGNKGGKNFTRVMRVKIGRARLIYAVSQELQRSTILMIGERESGSRDDVYEELAHKLKSAEFDAVFTELGLKKPDVTR
jgi:mRNA-degrading endonuclease RelE of RelBE toxin-antitoxin system